MSSGMFVLLPCMFQAHTSGSILHQRGFFQDVVPVNFNTIATPHVGLPRYPGMLSSLFAYFGPRLLSRTGEQFYVVREVWLVTCKSPALNWPRFEASQRLSD